MKNIISINVNLRTGFHAKALSVPLNISISFLFSLPIFNILFYPSLFILFLMVVSIFINCPR